APTQAAARAHRHGPVLSDSEHAGRLTHRAPRKCASACARPPRSRSCPHPLSLDGRKGTAGGQTSVGAMPRSYQVTPVDPWAATGDKTQASQATSRQVVLESARRQPEELPTKPDVTASDPQR